MKNLREFRNIDFSSKNIDYSIEYLLDRKNTIDFNIFLPTKNINLQRNLVWSNLQKQELIMSILLDRFIPKISILNIVNKNSSVSRSIFQIIDGKQRLNTIFEFVENKFTIELDGINFYFKCLPSDYQNGILNYDIGCNVIIEDYNTPFTDIKKIKWFELLNYAGTLQDIEHINKLKLINL